MATATVTSLSNAARCYDSCIPPGMQNAVAIYLLTQILKASDPMANISTAYLITQARCVDSCVPPGMQMSVMIYLLSQISAGSGGGLGGWTLAAGPPPTDGSVTTGFYKDTDSKVKYANLGTVAAPDWDQI